VAGVAADQEISGAPIDAGDEFLFLVRDTGEIKRGRLRAALPQGSSTPTG